MKIRLTRISIILFSAMCSVAAENPADIKPAAIAEVRTWGDLLAQEKVRVKVPTNTKWVYTEPSVQLGIDRTQCGKHGAVVLYCLVRGETAPLFAEVSEDYFGPFEIAIKTPGKQEIKALGAEIMDVPMTMAQGRIFLFMKIVPLEREGTYTIDVVQRLFFERERGKRTVATATVKVAGKSAELWSPWNGPEEKKGENNSAASAPDGDFSAMAVVNPAAGIALPAWQGWYPKIIEKLPAKKLPLPQLLPGEPDAGVQLSAESNTLIVKLDGRISAYFPDEKFLTRWWVNGAPFVPGPVPVSPRQAQKLATLEKLVGEVRFQVVFDPKSLGVKKGDSVGVQLLYCPQGWELENVEGAAAQKVVKDEANEAMETDAPLSIPISRRSNRVVFIYSGNPENMVQRVVLEK